MARRFVSPYVSRPREHAAFVRNHRDLIRWAFGVPDRVVPLADDGDAPADYDEPGADPSSRGERGGEP